MATVYLARDLRHGRRVAIKVVHPELTHSLGADRFLREIEIAASLNHPHILPLLDSGVEPGGADVTRGHLWYAMPYIEGESLRTLLRRERQLPVADALRIARDVAAALAHAHERGIVHRDIKPENILLSGGAALVADFGIARALTAAEIDTLTPSGLAVGTPAYMSPEQAAGDRSIDGRTDVYSLGCVLYEMLAGEPPFTGPTAQAILAKRLHGPLPSLRLVRDAVPPAVEAVVERALARVPADRFAGAAALREALTLPTLAGPAVRPPRAPPWRGLAIAGGAVVVAALALGALLRRAEPDAPAALDADLLAVAPFAALAPALHPWSEGIVDVLSRSLDGAGALRTVSPTLALKGWTGRADRASAETLARETGAGLVVYGSLDRRGPDSVAIRASLLDLARGEAVAEMEVAGDTLRMDGLVDSLAVTVLRELARTRPVGAVRRSPLGARSLPALKAFLRGEQFYRRNLWDSALTHYDRALALDSAFTLAYRRMRMLLEWNSPSAETFRPPDEQVLLRGALESNHGLAPRDSLLVALDSLAEAVVYWYRSGGPSLPSAYFRDQRRLVAALVEAPRRYPADPEVWHIVGEIGMHAQDPMLASNQDVLHAFDRAIALDSSFAPAYIHTPALAIAMETGDPARARRHLEAYLRLNPRDDHTVELRLVAALLDPARAGAPETDSAVARAPAGALWSAGLSLSGWPDTAETAVRLMRHLAYGEPDFAGAPMGFFIRDTLFRLRMLAYELARRGRLLEAYRLHPFFGVSRSERWRNPYHLLALLGAVPAETAAATFRRALEAVSPTDATGLVPVLAWWETRGDTSSLRRFAARLEGFQAGAGDNAAQRTIWRYGAGAARAYLLLAAGDSAAALRAFTALPDSVCAENVIECRWPRIAEARLLAAAGEDARAAAVLDTWARLEPMAVLDRARLAERLGDRQAAIRSYRYVAAMWRHADSVLQPYVAEATGGLTRLEDQPSEEEQS